MALKGILTNIILLLLTIQHITVHAAPHENLAEEKNKENKVDFINEKKPRTDYDEDESKNLIARVVGKRASIKDYPYTAAVIARTFDIGSGAILNKQWILTSGWVTLAEDPATTLIRVGSDLAIDKGQTSWASKLIPHPQYEHSWAYDISLIKLKKAIKFNKNVKAIKIANSLPEKGEKAVISAYGYSENTTATEEMNEKVSSWQHNGYLHATQLNVLPYYDCKEFYYYTASFTNNSFCTAGNEVTGPCTYDYGGPLVVNKKLVGVFSGVSRCLSKDYPPVYADVYKLRDWITATIKEYSSPSELEEYEKETLYYH